MDTHDTTPAGASPSPDGPSLISSATLSQRRLFASVALACCVVVLAGGTAYAGNPDFDRPFGDVQDIQALAAKIFQFGIVLCIMAAAIYIAIGAYAYFAAAGNAQMVGKGLEMMQRSVIGLILALISWVILNTISPQFTELKPPAGGTSETPDDSSFS